MMGWCVAKRDAITCHSLCSPSALLPFLLTRLRLPPTAARNCGRTLIPTRFRVQISGTEKPIPSNCWRYNPQKYAHSQKAQNTRTTMEHLKALLLSPSDKSLPKCTLLKVGMKVLSDSNCELLVLDKSDKKQGS
jgi:hypothetical protein